MLPFKLRIILCLYLLFSGSALADEHLIPEESFIGNPFAPRFGTYESNVVAVLKDAYADDVVARAIVFPSFSPEYAITLSRSKDSYEIKYIRPSHQIWLYEIVELYEQGAIKSFTLEGEPLDPQIEKDELEANLPASVDGVKVDVCRITIPRDTASALHTLWSEMLFRTRYIDRRPLPLDGIVEIRVGLDGTTYHFSMDAGIDTLEGKIWSPEPNSFTGRFVTITEMMQQACMSGDQELVKRTEHAAIALTNELPK